MKGIVLRRAKPSDVAGLVQMRKEGFRRKNWAYTGTYSIPSKKQLKEWGRIFAKRTRDNISIVAEEIETGKVIGSISGTSRSKSRTRHRLDAGWGVHPDYQKKGIGTMLLKALIAQAKKLKFKRIEAEMAIENIASVKLAKKCGFKIEGRMKKAMLTDDGRYIDTYIVGKIL